METKDIKYFDETLFRRFMHYVLIQPGTDCWIWRGAKQGKGYGCIGHRGKVLLTHRVAYQLFKGEIPDGMQVCHHCDNRCCVNPDHLFLGSNADNVIDKVRKGRQARLSGNGKSKLDEDKVDKIRMLYARGGYSYKTLADMFHVSKFTIGGIIRGELWKL